MDASGAAMGGTLRSALHASNQSCSHLIDCKQLPSTRNPFELVFASVDEGDDGTCDEIGHRSRHQHLAGVSSSCDSCPDVHCDPPDVVVTGFDLASVESSSNLYSYVSGMVADSQGALNGPARAVKDGKKAVAGRLDLSSSTTLQVGSDHCVMRIENLAPSPVTDRAC